MQSSGGSRTSKEFFEALTKVCGSYSGNSYFVGEVIPYQKVANARSAFSIPKTEQVIALVDATLFGKNDFGLAIGVNGIYWHNDWTTPTKKNYLSWNEFVSLSIRRAGAYNVEIGEGNPFNMAGSQFDKDKMVKLLWEIQYLVRNHISTPTSSYQQFYTSSRQQIVSSGVSKPSQQFFVALTGICASYTSDRYFVEELIPKDKLANVRSKFPIPKSEQVIALADTTIFANNDCGFAICENGIYWRNGVYTSTIKSNLTWDEFATVSIKYRTTDKNVVELGEGNAIFINIVLPEGKMVELLLKIQSLVRNPPSTPTSSEQWFIAASGQQFGPYDLSTIESMIASRQINPDECLSWKEGMENWLPFMEVPKLLALVQVSQPPALVAPPPLPAKPAPPPIPSQRLGSLDDVFATTPPNLKESNERVEAGRVDLNNAPLDDLLTLPGITLAFVEQLIKERDSRLGFETVEQVGHFLELQPHQVERLKKKAVLNPYKGQGSKRVTSARNRVIDF